MREKDSLDAVETMDVYQLDLPATTRTPQRSRVFRQIMTKRFAGIGATVAIALALLYAVAAELVAAKLVDWMKGSAIVVILVLSIGVLGAVAWFAVRRKSLQSEFSLFVASDRLTPEHLRFQVVAPRVAPVSLARRAYVEDSYIPRTAAPYDERHSETYSRTYSEQDLATVIEDGGSFLLLGRPTEGKTRTIFEVIHRLKSHWVVQPRFPLPSDEALGLLRGHRVVCMFDDINQSQQAGVDLADFYERLCSVTGTTPAIAASCRDGIEAEALRQLLLTSPLQRIYERIRLRLHLLPASDDEKRRLAAQLGKSPSMSYATLGHVAMQDAFASLEARFDALAPPTRECLWGVQLLNYAGVTPFTRGRVQAVVECVFGRALQEAEFNDCTGALRENGFIVSKVNDEQVIPEAAFIDAGGLPYRTPDGLAHDEPALLRMLLDTSDAIGANALALRRHLRGNNDLALEALNSVVGRFTDPVSDAERVGLARALVNAGALCAVRFDTKGAFQRIDEALSRYGVTLDAGGLVTAAGALQYAAIALNNGQFPNDEAVVLAESLYRCYRKLQELGIDNARLQWVASMVSSALTNVGGSLDETKTLKALELLQKVREGCSDIELAWDDVNRSIFYAANRLIHADDPNGALALVEKLVPGRDKWPMVYTKQRLGEAVNDAAAKLSDSGDPLRAAALFVQVARLLGEHSDLESSRIAAGALLNAALAYGRAHDIQSAVQHSSELVQRFRTESDLRISEVVLLAGRILSELNAVPG
jgi:hypothetical protein